MPLLNQNFPTLDALLRLAPQQVEQAMKWLDDPSPVPPPLQLQGLSPLEWHLLDVLLRALKAEKDLHPLQ